MGVVKCLWKQGLLPRVVSGASAGSIMVGILGVRTEHELSEMLKRENLISDTFRVNFFRCGGFSKTILNANKLVLYYSYCKVFQRTEV